MASFYKEFMDWQRYNFPGMKFTDYQDSILRTILTVQVPLNSRELAQRLKDLLPKTKAKS